MNTQSKIVTEETVTTESAHCSVVGTHLKRLSWTSILAGAFVGVGASFLLNLLCVGIGLSAFTATEDGATVLAIGGFVGLVIAAFVSMFAAGWVAAYLGRPFSSRRHLGELYGFITWSVALVLTILLTTHIGKFVTNFNDSMVNARAHTAVVNVTTNDAAPLVSQNTVTNPTTGATTTHATVNAEKATNALGATASATFFLFFIGAIASCFGGAIAARCGKRCVDADECRTIHHK